MEEEWIYLDKHKVSGKITAVSNLGRIIKNGKIIETDLKKYITIDNKHVRVNKIVADHFLITVKRPDQIRIKVIDRNSDNINGVTNLKYASTAEISSDAYSDPLLREKHSIRMKKFYQDPEFLEKMNLAIRNRKVDEHSRKKTTEGVKRYFSNPENRRRRHLLVKKINMKRLKLDGTENLASFLFFEDNFFKNNIGNPSSSAILANIIQNILYPYDRNRLIDKEEKRRNSRRVKSELLHRYTIDTIRRSLKYKLSSVSELDIFGDLF